MSPKKPLVLILLSILIAGARPAEACSLLTAGIDHPQRDAVGVPTNGEFIVYSSLGEPASAVLKADKGPDIPLTLVDQGARAHLSVFTYRAAADLAPQTAYRVVVDFGPNYLGGLEEAAFTTGAAADYMPPYIDGFRQASADYYGAGEAVEYFMGCGVEDVVLADAEPGLREAAERDGDPIGAHYRITVELEAFPEESHFTSVAMLRKAGTDFEVVQQRNIHSSDAALFEIRLMESEAAAEETYRFMATDIAGNENENLGEIVFELNQGASRILSSTISVAPQPQPPVPAAPASGGCSLSGSSYAGFSAAGLFAFTVVWFLTVRTLRRNDNENNQ